MGNVVKKFTARRRGNNKNYGKAHTSNDAFDFSTLAEIDTKARLSTFKPIRTAKKRRPGRWETGRSDTQTTISISEREEISLPPPIKIVPSFSGLDVPRRLQRSLGQNLLSPIAHQISKNFVSMDAYNSLDSPKTAKKKRPSKCETGNIYTPTVKSISEREESSLPSPIKNISESVSGLNPSDDVPKRLQRSLGQNLLSPIAHPISNNFVSMDAYNSLDSSKTAKKKRPSKCKTGNIYTPTVKSISEREKSSLPSPIENISESVSGLNPSDDVPKRLQRSLGQNLLSPIAHPISNSFISVDENNSSDLSKIAKKRTPSKWEVGKSDTRSSSIFSGRKESSLSPPIKSVSSFSGGGLRGTAGVPQRLRRTLSQNLFSPVAPKISSSFTSVDDNNSLYLITPPPTVSERNLSECNLFQSENLSLLLPPPPSGEHVNIAISEDCRVSVSRLSKEVPPMSSSSLQTSLVVSESLAMPLSPTPSRSIEPPMISSLTSSNSDSCLSVSRLSSREVTERQSQKSLAVSEKEAMPILPLTSSMNPPSLSSPTAEFIEICRSRSDLGGGPSQGLKHHEDEYQGIHLPKPPAGSIVPPMMSSSSSSSSNSSDKTNLGVSESSEGPLPRTSPRVVEPPISSSAVSLTSDSPLSASRMSSEEVVEQKSADLVDIETEYQKKGTMQLPKPPILPLFLSSSSSSSDNWSEESLGCLPIEKGTYNYCRRQGINLGSISVKPPSPVHSSTSGSSVSSGEDYVSSSSSSCIGAPMSSLSISSSSSEWIEGFGSRCDLGNGQLQGTVDLVDGPKAPPPPPRGIISSFNSSSASSTSDSSLSVSQMYSEEVAERQSLKNLSVSGKGTRPLPPPPPRGIAPPMSLSSLASSTSKWLESSGSRSYHDGNGQSRTSIGPVDEYQGRSTIQLPKPPVGNIVPPFLSSSSSSSSEDSEESQSNLAIEKAIDHHRQQDINLGLLVGSLFVEPQLPVHLGSTSKSSKESFISCSSSVSLSTAPSITQLEPTASPPAPSITQLEPTASPPATPPRADSVPPPTQPRTVTLLLRGVVPRVASITGSSEAIADTSQTDKAINAWIDSIFNSF